MFPMKKKSDNPPVISLVNLGCAKNLVDSERILGNLAESGFLIAQDPAVAEVCLVKTPRQGDQRRIAVRAHLHDDGFDLARNVLFRFALALDQRGELGCEILGACIKAACHQLTYAMPRENIRTASFK